METKDAIKNYVKAAENALDKNDYKQAWIYVDYLCKIVGGK